MIQALSVNVDDDMPTLGTAGTIAVDEDDLTAPPASFAGNSDVTAPATILPILHRPA